MIQRPMVLPGVPAGDRFGEAGLAVDAEPVDALDPLARLRDALNRAMPGERVRHAMAALGEIADCAEREALAAAASTDASELRFVAQSARVLRDLLREATPETRLVESRALVAHALHRVERFAGWSASADDPGRVTTRALCAELIACLSPRRERASRPRWR